MIIALIAMSVYSTFIGAAKAKTFFNSPLMMVFWIVSFLCCIISFSFIAKTTKSTSISMIFIASILIFAGWFWASKTGHHTQRLIFKNNKYQSGIMLLYQDQVDNVYALNNYDKFTKLPFHVKLEQLTIDYYESEPNSLPMTKEFFADIHIIKDKKIAHSKTIEANKPLHYGGYYFIQSDSGQKQDIPYIILNITSDSGIGLTFGGYIFLCIGLFWQLWFKVLIKAGHRR